MFETIFTKDETAKTMIVEREFAAPKDKVWQAWTTSDLLDQWWAPKPWKAITKSHEFKVGGSWLYAMTSPENEKHWAAVTYDSINPKDSFSGKDAFTDDQGNIDTTLPQMHWLNEFKEENGHTKVKVTTTFPDLDSMKKTIEMGVEKGFAMALENLDELLAK